MHIRSLQILPEIPSWLQQHLYFMCWLWTLMWWPLSAEALVLFYWFLLLLWKSPAAYVCSFISLHFSRFSIAQVLCPDVCISHGAIAETKTQRVAALAGLNHMSVQWLEELDKGCNPWPGSRARGPVEQDFLKGSRCDMNSAAGPVHRRPLPCVQHITSTNTSYNWHAWMTPSSLDFADWWNQGCYCCSGMLTLLYWALIFGFGTCGNFYSILSTSCVCLSVCVQAMSEAAVWEITVIQHISWPLAYTI